MKTLKDFQGQKLNKIMMSMLKGGSACAQGQNLYTCQVCVYGDCVSGYTCADNWGEAMLNNNVALQKQLGEEEMVRNTSVMC